VSIAIWLNVVPFQLRRSFFVENLQQWINTNLVFKPENNCDIPWNALWTTTCHWLWKWRNNEIHSDGFNRPADLWKYIRSAAIRYDLAMTNLNNLHVAPKIQVSIRWLPPQVGWVKLNIDGASRRGMQTGCGGIIRDSDGNWICGFTKGPGC